MDEKEKVQKFVEAIKKIKEASTTKQKVSESPVGVVGAKGTDTDQNLVTVPLDTSYKAPVINIIDRSTLLNDADHALMVEACKIQLEQHVAPLWNRGPWTIVEDQPDSVGFPIVILDDPDQAGVLGYHTKSPGGKVWARVFVRPVTSRGGSMLKGSLSVSAVLSHEVIEAYCNPDINIWARRKDGVLVAYESCDPVENDFYDITTSGGTKVSVSNFVLPSWFDPYPAPGIRFDYMRKVNSSLTMSKKGYIITLDPKTGGFRNVYGSKRAEELHVARQMPSLAARSTRMVSDPEEIKEEKQVIVSVP